MSLVFVRQFRRFRGCILCKVHGAFVLFGDLGCRIPFLLRLETSVGVCFPGSSGDSAPRESLVSRGRWSRACDASFSPETACMLGDMLGVVSTYWRGVPV